MSGDRLFLIESIVGDVPWYGLTMKSRDRIRSALRCRLARSWRERRACLALRLRGDGWTWEEIAGELGYADGPAARRSAFMHLLAEIDD